MRNKLIITGAIGVMAAATLTVNAQNGAQRTVHAKPASAVALAAVSADRDDRTIALQVTAGAAATAASKPAPEESAKPEVKVKAATAPAAVSTACSTAIANLKSMHQADVAEDAAERTSATGADARTAAAIASDRAEDAAEAQKWAAAVSSARTACTPATATTCRTAISGLQTILSGLRAQELAEPQGSETDLAADFSAVRTAFSAVATACANRE